MPIPDRFGNLQYQMVPVDVDEETLKKVADTTEAKFYRASDTDSLEKIYEDIDRLEKTKAKIRKFEHYQELFAWFLIPGLLLLGGEFWAMNTRYRRLP